MDPRRLRMRLVVFPDGVVDGAGELHDSAFPARLHNHRGTSGLDPKQKMLCHQLQNYDVNSLRVHC
jgi:hypothetical protein